MAILLQKTQHILYSLSRRFGAELAPHPLYLANLDSGYFLAGHDSCRFTAGLSQSTFWGLGNPSGVRSLSRPLVNAAWTLKSAAATV